MQEGIILIGSDSSRFSRGTERKFSGPDSSLLNSTVRWPLPACRPEVFRTISSELRLAPESASRSSCLRTPRNGPADPLFAFKSYANYPAYPPLGQKRFNAALNLLNSHLSQHSLRNRCQIVLALDYYSQNG